MIHFNETVGHKPGKIRKMLKKNKIGNLIRNSNSELFIKITVPGKPCNAAATDPVFTSHCLCCLSARYQTADRSRFVL